MPNQELFGIIWYNLKYLKSCPECPPHLSAAYQNDKPWKTGNFPVMELLVLADEILSLPRSPKLTVKRDVEWVLADELK